MKLSIILTIFLFFSYYSYCQDQSSIQCEVSSLVEGEELALEGGRFKPSANAPGEYMRALVVFVQFSNDYSEVADWESGELPDWAYDIFDSQTAATYSSGTVSDYFKDMSRGDFDFIADVHPDLITLTTHKPYYSANYDVMVQLNNQINDFSRYDNWSFDNVNEEFIFSESNGDNYLDMLIIIYRWGDNDANFGLKGGIANLGANFTTHDNIIIDGSGVEWQGSGITTQRAENTTYPPSLSIHIAHEYGHYLFGSDHAYYGLMTGKTGYNGQTGAMNSWEAKKLGYINYLEASYNGIPKTLHDYVTTGEVLRITIPFNSPSSSEYYLIENHQRISNWDYIIRGGSIEGSEYPNYTVGKGIYIWKVVGNDYPPNIKAVTADGTFDWEYVGDFNAGPGWYVDKPWEGLLPQTIRTAVNRYSGKNDRDPEHYIWHSEWAHKWVDVNPLTKNWEITRNVMGDEKDAYNFGYNNLLTPWSNPATTNDISFQIVSESQGDISVKAYSQSASGLALPPSKPQFFKVNVVNGFAQLTWEQNIEPDMQYSGKYRIYSASTSGSEPTTFSYKTEINAYNGTTPITSWTDPDPWVGQGSLKLFYRITAVDNGSQESVPSDYDYVPWSGYYQKQGHINNIAISDYKLYDNYPNPFNPTTTIYYDIKNRGLVNLAVFDILGKLVANLVNESKDEGRYSINFNASNLPSGVYIYTLRVNDFIASKKMTVVK